MEPENRPRDYKTRRAEPAAESNRPTSAGKWSRRRIVIIVCGVIVGLLLVLRLTALIFSPSAYEVLSESPKVIVPEIGGIKIGDSLADAKAHMEVMSGREGKTTGNLGYKTISADWAEVSVVYCFIDSRVVDIHLQFTSTCFDVLVDTLSDKCGAKPYMMRRDSSDGDVTKLWKMADGDFALSNHSDLKGLGTGGVYGGGRSAEALSIEVDEQNRHMKETLKKQL